MDMVILLLVIGGNILLFYGFFSLLGRTIFKEIQEYENPLEEEMKQIERELRRF